MKKKVLITGTGQANYILQLYENIAPELSRFSFSSINLKGFGNLNVHERAEKIFKYNYQFGFPSLNLGSLLKGIIHLSASAYFWKDHRIHFAEKGLLNYLAHSYRLTKQHLHAYSFARFIDGETSTDIIHFHFLNHKHGLFINYLQKDYKIIYTYWGSDIFRISKWKDHEIQKTILPKGNLITAATPEMQFAIQNRFGFNLLDKFRTARFIHDETFYNVAEQLLEGDKKWKADFKEKLNIAEDKLVILYGHNAVEENNHLKFIEILKEIPEEIIEKFHVVFPLSYGYRTMDHINYIKKQCSNLNTGFTYIEKFLDWEMMAKLKIISDVYIHAPTTDGLSAFLTEFFYTNNLAIVGSWLPYKTFKNYGLEYVEFNDFSDLKEILKDIEQYLSIYKPKVAQNRNLIIQNFSISEIQKNWLDIYSELDK